MPLTLQNIPGFADLPDSSFAAENAALGDNLNRMSLNAAFGMVRPEVFSGLYKHGESVLLPVSPVDGYIYQQSELIYVWATQSTLNPTSGWITGPDCLWYCAWNVSQTTGAVECIEFYRRSGSNDQGAQSNDGALRVFTIGMRQKNFLILDHPADSFTDQPNGNFATDLPYSSDLSQPMNRAAKFAVLNSEVIWMGEFVHGGTVPQPVSPADGYVYSYSQVKFAFSWRWTTTGSAFTVPDKLLGQLATMKASINASTGVVTCQVYMIWNDSSVNLISGYGRISVVAFCSRNNLIIGGFSSPANAFAEIDPDVFQAGQTLRASTMLQLMKNIRESACSCEFFGPTTHQNGDTIALPSSPVDGYNYSRDEISILWEWSDTTNQTGVHLRVAAFWGDISQSTGVVTLRCWRLPPGGPYVEDGDSFLRINTIIVAQRGAQHSTLVVANPNPAGDAGSAVVDQNQPDNSPYAISYFAGETGTPGGSEQILKHIIPGDVASVTLPINLLGSYASVVTAPTGSATFTIKKNTTTIGSFTFAAAASTATFSFLAAVTLSPGDLVNVIAPSTPDATLAGLHFSLAGTRT